MEETVSTTRTEVTHEVFGRLPKVRIVTMDSADEYFYNNVLCSSSSFDSSDDEAEVLVATLVVNDHLARQAPMYRGSVPGRAPALARNREAGHVQLFKD